MPAGMSESSSQRKVQESKPMRWQGRHVGGDMARYEKKLKWDMGSRLKGGG